MDPVLKQKYKKRPTLKKDRTNLKKEKKKEDQILGWKKSLPAIKNTIILLLAPKVARTTEGGVGGEGGGVLTAGWVVCM